jgi:hypothetical protein
MLCRSQGIDSRVTLSQSRAHIVPLLLALTALPSFLALVTTRYGLLHYANLIRQTGPIIFFQPT